jgi:hypothetical protein
MDKRIIAVVAAAAAMGLWCFGCAPGSVPGGITNVRPESAYDTFNPSATPPPAQTVGSSDLVYDPSRTDPSAFPALGDLPYPEGMKKAKAVRRYTGIIKNQTRYEVEVASENSDATLTIPPHSWIEYTMWTPRASVTAYRDGKPFYCLKILAQPREYAFMCSKYDFMAEIVKPEPVVKKKYRKLKRRIRKVPKECAEGTKGLG